jgi:hypothetical protein
MASERWLCFRRKPMSDDEFIERIRQGIIRFQRRRKVLVIFSATFLVVAFAFAIFGAVVVHKVGQLLQGLQPAIAGLLIGANIGAALGLGLFKSINGLMDALLWDNRTERLLIRYYDALKELAREAPQSTGEGAASSGSIRSSG